MRYYKQRAADGTLIAIGTGAGGTEITAAEYAALSAEISQKAALVDAIVKGTMTAEEAREDWREEILCRAEALRQRTAAYTQEALEEMTNAELEAILGQMGVSANMTKANMVTLILALQEAPAP